MLNVIWLILILSSLILSASHGTIAVVVNSVAMSAKAAVELALGLIGIMAFWLGLMKIAQDAGLIQLISRGLRPIMQWLFPDVPRDHPALGAISLNIAANMMGLGNAATPFGLRAMEQLEQVNKLPGTASDAMCMFVAINTSSVQLIPTFAISILASYGDSKAASIIVPVILATTCSTIIGIAAAKVGSKLTFFKGK